MTGCTREFPGQRDAVREAGDQAKDGPARETEPGSEKCTIGDRARECAQRSVLTAQQIVREIKSAQHVERIADDADKRESVDIQYHVRRGTRAFTDRIRNHLEPRPVSETAHTTGSNDRAGLLE